MSNMAAPSLDMEDNLCKRFGLVFKRLLSTHPLRYRKGTSLLPFQIYDDPDDQVCLLVRSRQMLQISTSAASFLVVDIDTLHASPLTDQEKKASAAPFCGERLRCAALLLNAMLESSLGVTMEFFSSANQGVHGWVLGHLYAKEVRRAVASLLPSGVQECEDAGARYVQLTEWFDSTPEYNTDEVKHAAQEAFKFLSALDYAGCGDEEWIARMQWAARPEASHGARCCAITAFYDTVVTFGNQIRVPCAFNEKNKRYGFPLGPPDLSTGTPVAERWSSMVGQTEFVPSELDVRLLEEIELPTREDTPLISEMADLFLKAHTCRIKSASRKRARLKTEKEEEEEEEERETRFAQAEQHTLIAPPPDVRMCKVDMLLPTDLKVREALIPAVVRKHLSVGAINALESGMKEGGTPLCDWYPEPAHWRIRETAYKRFKKGKGLKPEDAEAVPLALNALCGLNVTHDDRFAIARSLIASSFPIDFFFLAMVLSPNVRREVLPYWASFLRTYTEGNGQYTLKAWRYDIGRTTPISHLPHMVRLRCLRAKWILEGGHLRVIINLPLDVSGEHEWDLSFMQTFSTSALLPRCGKIVSAKSDDSKFRIFTNFSFALKLETTADAMKAQAVALVKSRDSYVDERTRGLTRDEVVAGWERTIGNQVDRLFQARDDKTQSVAMREFIGSSGRYDYLLTTDYSGVKSLMREVKVALLRPHDAWTADIRRCHTSMLLGCYKFALDARLTKPHALLDRMLHDMPSLEAELAADQDRLKPEAEAQIRWLRDNGADEKELAYAQNMLNYLSSDLTPPKTLLSIFLNQLPAMHERTWAHKPRQPKWPLAAQCCRALGVAAGLGRLHPLVKTDPFRPDVRGEEFKPGSVKERQAIANILERNCLFAMRKCFHALGIPSAATINDEMVFYPKLMRSGVFDQERVMDALLGAIKGRVQFPVALKMNSV